QYMGCVEVLQSMRMLDFNTRTQVTREAISLVCEAVPGAKGAVRRRKVPPVAPAETQVGSSLCSAFVQLKAPRGSGPCLELPRPAAHGHCQGISPPCHKQTWAATSHAPSHATPCPFLPLWRTCHILECPEGLAQDVISTIGQAFELRFKQYLKNPPKLVTPHDRMAGFDGSAWDEEEEEPSDHQYYNDFPGKEPPLGGVVDMRLRDGASAAPTPNHLGATLPVGQMSSGEHDPRKQQPPAQGRDKYAPGAGPAPRPDLFDDPSYVNVQNLDRPRQASAASVPATANGNAQRDLFDMKPFEDALRGPAPGPVGLPPAQLLGCMEEQLGRGAPESAGWLGMEPAPMAAPLGSWVLCEHNSPEPCPYLALASAQPQGPLATPPQSWVRTKDHRFESVSHLISYQMDNHLPIISAGPEL
uniref:SHC adaptor protein 1 n=1 Tax=Pelodiscus sinensis TaxID=13735 RepID=K7GFV6_PELSI